MNDPEISQFDEYGHCGPERLTPPPEIAPPAAEWQTSPEEQRPPEYGTQTGPRPRRTRRRQRGALAFTALAVSAVTVVTTASVASGGTFLPGLSALASGLHDTYLSSPLPASPLPASTSGGGEDRTDLNVSPPGVSPIQTPPPQMPESVPAPTDPPETYDPVPEDYAPRPEQPVERPPVDATLAPAPTPGPTAPVEAPAAPEPTPAPEASPSSSTTPTPTPEPSPTPTPTPPPPSPKPDDADDDGSGGGYEPPPHTHVYGAWTDSGDGINHIRVCTEDGIKQTAPHSFGTWSSAEDGRGHIHTCTVCGAQVQESHTWGAGTEATSATCTTEGLRTSSCTACGAEKAEPIPKLPHDWGVGWADAGDGQNHARTCLTGGERETEPHELREGVCVICGTAVTPPADPAPLTMPTAAAPSYSVVESTGGKAHTIFTGAYWTRDTAETGLVVAVWTICPMDAPDTQAASGEQDVRAYSSGIEVSGLTPGTVYTVTVKLVYRVNGGDYKIEGLIPKSTNFTAEDISALHERHKDADGDGICDVCGEARPEITLTASVDYDYDGAGQVRLMYTLTPEEAALGDLTFIVQYQQDRVWIDTDLLLKELTDHGFYRWHVFGSLDGWIIDVYSSAVEYS